MNFHVLGVRSTSLISYPPFVWSPQISIPGCGWLNQRGPRCLLRTACPGSEFASKISGQNHVCLVVWNMDFLTFHLYIYILYIYIFYIYIYYMYIIDYIYYIYILYFRYYIYYILYIYILGMSSSQLTNSIIFQRGRSTTNQMYIAK